jgi:predicted RNase H-like nuclease (RuvC/YqgF family)
MLTSSNTDVQEKINRNSTYLVDRILSMLYCFVMPLLTDAQRAVKQRLLAACERVRELRAEQKTLASAYERYNILQKELKQQEKRIDRLAGLIGPNLFLAAELEDNSSVIIDTVETHTTIDQLRNELSLWEAMVEYLSYAEEARIQDIQTFLESFGIMASREAVESALKRHPETFKSKKRGGTKLVSLKKGE